MSQQQIRVVVWTPCSVLLCLGCGGLVLVWLVGLAAVMLVPRPEVPPPEPPTVILPPAER